MRAALALLVLAILTVLAAFNAGALIDAWIGIYSYPPARQLLSWSLGLIGAGAAVLALLLISRRAYRQVERDFPDTFNDRRN